MPRERVEIPVSIRCPVCGKLANRFRQKTREYFCINCMMEICIQGNEVKLYDITPKGTRKVHQG